MEVAAGKAVFTRIGEMSFRCGIMKMLLQQLAMTVGYAPPIHKLEAGSPNTAFAHHQ